MKAEEGIIKRMVLKAVTKCGVCGHGYTVEDVDVLGHVEGLWFFLLNCGECHDQGLVAAVVKEDEDSEVTDWEIEEVSEDVPVEVLQRPPDQGTISNDDLIDMHLFLKDFDGDFRRLFSAHT